VEKALNGYTARKAFGKDMARSGARGEVFRYRDWVGGILGGEGKEEEIN